MFGIAPVFGGGARALPKGSTVRGAAATAPAEIFNDGDAPLGSGSDESEDSDSFAPGVQSRGVDPDAPEGYVREVRCSTSGRVYSYWFSPDGKKFTSRLACWEFVNGGAEKFVARTASDDPPASSPVVSLPRPQPGPTQCGNPECVKPSVNGSHPGPHVFRAPGPRRR
jgi:hypothetical protein